MQNSELPCRALQISGMGLWSRLQSSYLCTITRYQTDYSNLIHRTLNPGAALIPNVDIKKANTTESVLNYFYVYDVIETSKGVSARLKMMLSLLSRATSPSQFYFYG